MKNNKISIKILKFVFIIILSNVLILLPNEVNADDEVIDVAFATVTEPVVGEAPSFNVTPGDSSKYWIDYDYISWYRQYPTSGPVGDTFQAGRIYSVRVLFRPKTGYTFSEDTLFLINGKKTGQWGDSNAMAYSYFTTVNPTEKVQVRFKYQDENDNYVSFSQVTIDSGDTVNKPEMNPTKNGFTFVKWKTANGYNVNFSSSIFSDTSYYAEFVENGNLTTNTITLNPNNNTLQSYTISNIVNGSVNKLETPDKYGLTIPDGWQFYGWKIDNEIYLPGEYFEVNSNVTAVAQYVGSSSNKEEYTIHVDNYDITLNKKWSGGYVYLETEAGTNGYQDAGYAFTATEGSTVKIDGFADDEYAFVEWRIGTPTGPTFSTKKYNTFTATQDLNLVAIYRRETISKGDMNNDTFINSTDAAMVLDKFKNGNATAEDFERGNMNGDTVLNATDAAMILDIYKNS